MRTTCLFIAVGLIVGVTLLILAGTPIAAQEGAAPQNGDVCFARGYEGGTNPGVVFSSADSQAVRDAIAGAGDADVVAVAGYCAGVKTFPGGIVATVLISDDITLRGGYTSTGWIYDPDTYTTTLDAQRSGRVVYMAGGSHATLDSMHVISGTSPNDQCGGGIHIATGAMATVTHSTIFSNTSNHGGGICVNEAATATIAHSTIYDNLVDLPGEFEAAGGGIFVRFDALVTVTQSIVRDNRAEAGGGIFSSAGATTYIAHSTIGHNHSTEAGGGLALNIGLVKITHSTLDSNNAATDGGGIANRWGTVHLTNTTVSGNQAARGGGISNEQATAYLTTGRAGLYAEAAGQVGTHARIREHAALINCTVTGNQATTGSGIANIGSNQVILSNTIVAGQTSGADCSGTITSQGHNLDSDDTCDLSGARDDIISGDADLGPLQLNAPGDTATHALGFSSDAIDAGDCAGDTVGDDQRGVTRPSGGACDIGSYEFGAQPSIAVSKTPSRATAGLGATVWYSYRVTNTGNLPLSSVQAVDDKLGLVLLDKDTLDPNESTTGTHSHTVVEADLPGPIVNTVIVSGTPPASAVLTATDKASVALTSEPAIAVLKTAGVASATLGDTIWYSYRITNTGNVILGNVRAVDDKLGALGLAKTTLAPEEATTASISYVVVETDLPGPLTNTVIVSGTPPAGADVTATGEAVVSLVQTGHSVFLPLVTKNLEP